MKFKSLIISFSIIIILFASITILLPRFFTEVEFAQYFRVLTLPLLLFMALLLTGTLIFFLLNYRLFSLLEREDWPALSYYLENIIYSKGRYSVRKVRLLAGSYLVILDYASVFNLEGKALHIKPSTVEKNALIFGAARILCGKSAEAVEFFKTHLEKGKKSDRQWIRWFYGFSLLLCGAFVKAEQEFTPLAEHSKNALICGLSSYFLEISISNHSQNPEECKAIAENGRSRIVKTFKDTAGWEKEANKMGSDIHVAIIRKYVDEAGQWLFPKEG